MSLIWLPNGWSPPGSLNEEHSQNFGTINRSTGNQNFDDLGCRVFSCAKETLQWSMATICFYLFSWTQNLYEDWCKLNHDGFNWCMNILFSGLLLAYPFYLCFILGLLWLQSHVVPWTPWVPLNYVFFLCSVTILFYLYWWFDCWSVWWLLTGTNWHQWLWNLCELDMLL